MNVQIRRLFGVVVLLFALLVGFTSRWSVFDAESLQDSSANRRPLLEEQRIPRGTIYARDGTPLTRNRRLGSGSSRRFVRSYPQGRLFSHVLGYSFVSRGRAGLEKSRNDELTGEENELASILDELAGSERVGHDVRTTLDPQAQRAAIQGLAGRRGSIVAIEPATGRVRVMASFPDFDPNDVPRRFSALNRDRSSPLFNRATQGRYPPGSTFKVVTASAALDSGRYTPTSIVSGKSPKVIDGVPLSNCCGEGTGDYGPLTLTQGLTSSVNTVWAEVGERLGKGTMLDYMGRFGFGDEPPIDYPKEQLTPSGVFQRGRLLDRDDPIDIGRVAIGQERLQVTPLQMAMVAAGIANGGRLMRPRLVERVVARDGRVKKRIKPKQAERVMKAETAAALAGMMRSVVEQGTARAAAIEGVSVAGKTGTAEVEGGAANQAWFIAFAPVEAPRVAIAVTIERTQGQGGTVAAPLAKPVIRSLLRG